MNRLFEFFINRWRITILLVIASTIFGAFSLASLPLESDPEVEIPYASVTVVYPGASPSDMEKLVTRKVEDKLNNLDNLEQLSSTTSLGMSNVFVEFQAGVDVDASIRDLKDKIDEVKADLPDEAEDPVVTEITTTDTPIITFSLGGKGLSEDHLSDVADAIKTELENITGVSKVTILGKRDQEVQILLERDKLEALGISTSTIIQKIQASHLDFPIGEAMIEGVQISLRLEGQFEGAEDLKNLPIISTETGTIFLGDIATVKESRKKEESRSLLSLQGKEPIQTVSLQIYKKTGGNIVNITDTAKATLDEMKASGKLPENLEIEVSNDNSKIIRDDISTLSSNGLQTIIIVTVLIWLALGWREALLAGLSLPLIFLLTFATLNFQGQTLNSMSLFSLVLSLGLIVDNTIVITEGIFDNLRIKRMPAKKAALDSVKTFWGPITSGTLTTVAAFVPMLLVSGMMGEYLSIIPITISATLLWSLAVAMFIVPSISAMVFKKLQPDEHKESAFVKKSKSILGNILKRFLNNRAKRLGMYLTAILLFIGAMALPISGAIPVEMFPSYDADYFNINVEMPPGTNLERTYEESLPVKEILMKNPYVDNFLFAVGAGAVASTSSHSGSGSGGTTSTNQASFTVNLTPADDRDIESYQIANMVREEIQKIDTAGKISIEELQAGPPSGKPIEIRVFGENLAEMETLIKKIKAEAEKIPGLIEISDDISLSSGEFVFRLKKEQLDYYGLTPAQVGSEIRTAVFGTDAGEIARGDDDIKINVAINWQNSDEQPTSISDIENLPLVTPKGEIIKIKDVADISLEQGFSSIEHQDKKKILRVQADVETGAVVSEKTAELQKAVEENITIPKNITVEFGGSTEDIDESFTDLFKSMIVAVILIAFILVLEFQSFSQPFIIMLSLPLSLIGVMYGFLLIGWPISFPTFIGIVSLSGIVVNDAIVLISRIRENRDENMELKESIIEAATSRIKPIALTSLTTIFGILPLALSDAIWGGLGFAIVFGLIFSTILTLIVIPNFYYTFEARGEKRRLQRIAEGILDDNMEN